jgi:glucose-6-phosphate dehydrogenase assembly protein OpcA
MSTQLTLQAPLEVPPAEVTPYLERLWHDGLEGSTGAATFTLLVWDPAWLEQQLVRMGRVDGPITGLDRADVLDAARGVVSLVGLPHSTAPMDPRLAWALGQQPGSHEVTDLRGRTVESAISSLTPRRLITLAPTLDDGHPLETLVAAYCPLPDDGGIGGAACGDVVVLRGGMGALKQGLALLQGLVGVDLPCWVWWNSSLDEPPEMLEALAPPPRRLVIDTSLGDPRRCLEVLVDRIDRGQALNDLNWLRLRSWRESLAMVFDPPSRRDALGRVVQLDIDVEGEHPVKGLLLAAWIADRLGWHLVARESVEADVGHGIAAEFQRTDGATVRFKLMPVPVGVPKAHPGAIVGLRLICEPTGRPPLCVILCSESGGCMRLESGGMASMELAEEVVPLPEESEERELARLLGGGHDTTNPLLAAAAPLAAELLPE